jgi:sugar/nucleoside kinase (ribokinase family)
VGFNAGQGTSFENVLTAAGRQLILHHAAPPIDASLIPAAWRKTPILHLGPIAQEVDPAVIRHFPEAHVFVTAQGWLRNQDRQGHIHPGAWPRAAEVLSRADAAVISLEDINNDEQRIAAMAQDCRVLAVTRGARGTSVYWGGKQRTLAAPQVKEVDPVGAGDIFAAAFFIHLGRTGSPWEAAAFANHLAAQSVTRLGLEGIPKPEEVASAFVKV